MSQIKANDINPLNTTIYNISSQAKVTTALPSANQTPTGNAVTAGTVLTPVNINNIKTAIKTLEQKFSNNCCQSQCTSHLTSGFCQVYGGQTCQSNCYSSGTYTVWVTKYVNTQCTYYNSHYNSCDV